jgi:predicted transcriptional regulator of viral defense system
MGGEESFRHDMAVQMTSRSADGLLGELADRQYGVVSHPQLRQLGLGRGAIQHRLDLKRLYVVHRGVYAVGRLRLTRSGVWMAAVLACGPGAVLSHRSAAALWGVRRGDPSRTEVTAPGRVGRRKGIRAHRVSLRPDEITEVDGIPITTAARTLLDLAAVVDRHEVQRAMEQAEALRLADHTPLTALVARYPGRRGTAVLKEILRAERRVAGITRSELEDRFLRFLADRELPAPRTNVWLQIGEDWVEGDCVWSDHRVVVEQRDRPLKVAGWEPIRVTSWDLDEDPERLEQDLLALTSVRRATP